MFVIPAVMKPDRKPWPALMTGAILLPVDDLQGLTKLFATLNAASPRVDPMFSGLRGAGVVVVVVTPRMGPITLPILSKLIPPPGNNCGAEIKNVNKNSIL